MEIDDGYIKIRILLKDKNNLLANATVSIETINYGFVTIKDFQIWRSQKMNGRLQEFINIKPPQRNVYSKWIDRVFFEDRERWIDLEARVYDAYCIARNNSKEKQQ